jgi:hypothetical protein
MTDICKEQEQMRGHEHGLVKEQEQGPEQEQSRSRGKGAGKP